MPMNPIESAPKDHYLLGYDATYRRPFMMHWNVPAESFIESNSPDIAPATHWTFMPALPNAGGEGWLPLDQAPKEGYCLGFDECLKHPFVMKWSNEKNRFVVQHAFGDEVPTMFLPIPTVT